MLKNKIRSFIKLTLAVFVPVLFFSVGCSAIAASLYISPSSGAYSVGATFTSSIKVNTDSQSINASEGVLSFNPAELQVVSVSKSSSVFSLWVQDPSFDNSAGTITFGGIIFNPGYSGSSGQILSITFKAKSPASSKISFSSGDILANDGVGTNILSNFVGASFNIKGPSDVSNSPSQTVNPTPIANEEQIPQIVSSTHPDSLKWYSNNNPEFSWNIPSNVTGVSYLITNKATSNPGPKSDGVVGQASFSNIADGTQYFNIKFKTGNSWGAITHYQFNIDTVAPNNFDVHVATASATEPYVVFETTDALSGIDHYEIKIGETGDWKTIPVDQAGKPYLISSDKAGTEKISVKAVDKAGNSTTESTLITTTAKIVASSAVGLWLSKVFNGVVNGISNYGLLIALIAAIIGILILLYRLLGAGADRLWHRIDDRRVIKKTEHAIDNKFDEILKDMQEEVKFIETIAKRRPLGPEEKYLKSKLLQYIKGLKK